MIARKNNNTVEISFKYDPMLVSFVKSLEGRKYNPATKLWSIPLAGSHANVERLAQKGFMIDPDLWAEVRKDQEQAREAEALAMLPDTEFTTFLPLYGFQRVCSAFMVRTGSCLNACGVGTGKTVMALAAVVKTKSEKNLVVCPKSLIYQWENEILRFTPQYKVFLVAGNVKQRKGVYKKALDCCDPYFLIVSYDLARIDCNVLVAEGRTFRTIIYDEGHRLGNVRTKTYRAIQKISQSSQYRYALTATPMMNRPAELYGILNTLQPGCLGAYEPFLGRYMVRNQWGGMLYPINQSELAQRLKRYMIRKSLEEVAPEMPSLTIEDIPFDLSEKERTLYDRLKKELLFEVERHLIDKIERPMVIQMTLTKMLVLTELTCSLELLGEDKTSSKLDVLKDRLEDILLNGEKVIVFSRFEKMTAILARELAQYNPLLITGKVTGEDRDLAVQKFQKDDEYKLLISTDAGGEGLNLDTGSIVFHYDLPWSYGKYVQRNGRVKRLTQRKPMMVYNLVARKSMDGYMAKVLNAKSKLSSALLDESDTPISMEHIQEMLHYEE